MDEGRTNAGDGHAQKAILIIAEVVVEELADEEGDTGSNG